MIICNALQWGARFTSCCDSSRRSWLHWYLLISHYFVVYFLVLSYLVKFYHILPYKWNHLHQGTRTTGCYDSAQRCWSVILEAFLRHSHLLRTISAIEFTRALFYQSRPQMQLLIVVWCPSWGIVWYDVVWYGMVEGSKLWQSMVWCGFTRPLFCRSWPQVQLPM